MNVSVTYEDSDVAKALDLIIKHQNKDEFVKLFTPLICGSHPATEYFFKLLLGNLLPEVIPNGTLCKIKVNQLGYGSNKQALTEQFADEDNKVVVTVKEFRGYHEYSQYQIEYLNILDDNLTTKKDLTYVHTRDLTVIEDF
jgi:hypothetical protein